MFYFSSKIQEKDTTWNIFVVNSKVYECIWKQSADIDCDVEAYVWQLQRCKYDIRDPDAQTTSHWT